MSGANATHSGVRDEYRGALGQHLGGNATTPAPTTITTVLSANEDAIAQVHGAINALEEALQTLLMHDAPDTCGTPVAPKGSPQVLDRVLLQNEAILAASARLNRLRKRLML